MSAQAITLKGKGKQKTGIRWGRLLWTIFVVLYFINFTKNLFADVAPGRAAIPIIYFVLWLCWLGVEFYLSALFFQSSLVPRFNPWLKASFAVYFYGLQGLAGWDAFGGTQIHFLYPLFNVIGLLIFALGIVIRLGALLVYLRTKDRNRILASRPWQMSRHPRYVGMLLIMFAIPLVFFSPWAMLATVVIGLPLWYLSVRFEERKLKSQWGNVYEDYCKTTPLRPRLRH
ncbi:MAG: isoprenylcysteine carboxylmethyltransferase family protein [Candidatus Stahlbacteria bacterium]|nr:MAG: isoprenylcysteine carboxylmethyltransferase family protein [Candidatus Stahlbacteria bacterium]